jgi:hypothetical protein
MKIIPYHSTIRTLKTERVLFFCGGEGGCSLRIATTLLEEVIAAHDAFRLLIDSTCNEQQKFNIGRTSARAKILQVCKLIGWCMCKMSHKANL